MADFMPPMSMPAFALAKLSAAQHSKCYQHIMLQCCTHDITEVGSWSSHFAKHSRRLALVIDTAVMKQSFQFSHGRSPLLSCCQ
eukprot:2295583-Amphidinium_carterae.1